MPHFDSTCYTPHIRMNIYNPLLLVSFFSAFHLLGGLAFGKGLRDTESKQLILWGGFMGITPIVFDWAFLIREDMLFYGLIGPTVFVIAGILGYSLLTTKFSKANEKSIGAIMMGASSLLIGLILAPYLINQVLTLDLQPADYLFGSCLLVLPILVGIGFIWSGFTAILKKRTYDEHVAEREIELEEKISRKKKSK